MGSTREEDEIAPDQEIDFCTLGMFIVGQSAFTWLSPPPLAAFVSISYSLLCVHVLQVAGERYQSHSCGLSRRALESHFTPFYFCPTPWASQVNGQWNLIIGILFIYYKPESIRSSRNDIFTKLLTLSLYCCLLIRFFIPSPFTAQWPQLLILHQLIQSHFQYICGRSFSAL
jgi:hypothetical protein